MMSTVNSSLQRFKIAHHGRLGILVERAGRLVENQHRCPLVERTRDADPLALAARQPDAAFAHLGLEPVRERLDEAA